MYRSLATGRQRSVSPLTVYHRAAHPRQRLQTNLPARIPGPANAVNVAPTRSAQTVCQMPLVRYHILCGSRRQSCFPRFSQVMGIVSSPDGDPLWPEFIQYRCNVNGERYATLMVSDELAVDPHGSTAPKWSTLPPHHPGQIPARTSSLGENPCR